MLMIPGLNKNVENDRERDCGLVDNDKHETSDICGEEEHERELENKKLEESKRNQRKILINKTIWDTK